MRWGLTLEPAVQTRGSWVSTPKSQAGEGATEEGTSQDPLAVSVSWLPSRWGLASSD